MECTETTMWVQSVRVYCARARDEADTTGAWPDQIDRCCVLLHVSTSLLAANFVSSFCMVDTAKRRRWINQSIATSVPPQKTLPMEAIMKMTGSNTTVESIDIQTPKSLPNND